MKPSSGVGIDETAILPDRHGISVYPNPFNAIALLQFQARQAGHVNVKVFNIPGQLVDTPVDEVMSPDLYERPWSLRKGTPGAMPSGVYLIHLNTGTQSEVVKATFLK